MVSLFARASTVVRTIRRRPGVLIAGTVVVLLAAAGVTTLVRQSQSRTGGRFRRRIDGSSGSGGSRGSSGSGGIPGLPAGTGVQRPHTFRWLPGQHVLNVSNTNPGVRVAEDGTLILGGNLSSYESGAGTSTLVLNGFALTIDARASSLDFTMDDEGIVYPHTSVHVLHLLPANHWYTSTMPGDDPFTVSFVLTYSGTVDMNAAQTGASGEGTSTLTVTGP